MRTFCLELLTRHVALPRLPAMRSYDYSIEVEGLTVRGRMLATDRDGILAMLSELYQDRRTGRITIHDGFGG